MSVTVDILRLQLDYSAWANQSLLDAAAKLSPEELRHDFKTGYKNVLDTLAHVYAADRFWLAQVLAEPRDAFIDPGDRDLVLLQVEWPKLYHHWKRWLCDLKDGDSEQWMTYHDLERHSHAQPLWQIILHMVNHGTHHRGQVCGFLRAMGHTPPYLDLNDYYLTLA